MNINCPNCGAPITSNQCSYCGTLFELKTTRKADFYAQDEIIHILEEIKNDIERSIKNDRT